jgi:hypothetical protein
MTELEIRALRERIYRELRAVVHLTLDGWPGLRLIDDADRAFLAERVTSEVLDQFDVVPREDQ